MPPLNPEQVEVAPEIIPARRNGFEENFLSPSLPYYLPEHICSVEDGKLTFNFLIKILYSETNDVMLDFEENTCRLRFSDIILQPQVHTIHYALMVKFPPNINLHCASILSSGQYTLFSIRYVPATSRLPWFLCGRTDSDLEKVMVKEYQIIKEPCEPEYYGEVDITEITDEWITTEV